MADSVIIEKNITSRARFLQAFAILGITLCALIWLLVPLNAQSTDIILFVIAFCSLSIVLHYAKLFNASRFVLLHCMALIVGVAHAYQMQPGEGTVGTMVMFQLVYLTLPLAVFAFSEKKEMITSIAINLVILLVTPLCNNIFNAPPDTLNMRYGTVANIFYFIGGILVILPLLYSIGKSYNWMKELKDKIDENKILNGQNTDANYIMSNLVKFSAIMRDYNDAMDILCNKALSNMVEVLQSGHGAIFIYNKETNLLELSSRYAFDGNKEGKKYLLPGETLAGQAFTSKKIIHITNVSADYYNIKSGLGFARPSELLIVPVIFNDDCYGVIELASFNTFKKIDIRLLEQLSELLAATVSNLQNNLQNTDLVEKLQHQAEELKTKEEELLSNIESLNETQLQMESISQKTSLRIEEQMDSQRELMQKTIVRYNEAIKKLQENEYKLEIDLRQAREELAAMKGK